MVRGSKRVADKPWDVQVLAGLHRFINQFDQQRRGYLQNVIAELRDDPCRTYKAADGHQEARFYRLSGSLARAICGGHMQDQWRLAFTLQPAESEEFQGTVLILYVDRYIDRIDPWKDLHRLFGASSPSKHDKPPCCDGDLKPISKDALDRFERNVSQFLLDKHFRKYFRRGRPPW